ncbi:MAG: PAS domain-containing protein, partial [Coleofasciculus sp. Co-bin14]|nr:PAS domain-containing protein [Coleofasciculus sp. Co-bin14]
MARLEVGHSSLVEPTLPVEEPATPVLEILSDPHKSILSVDCDSQDPFLSVLFQAIPVPVMIARLTDGVILYANEHYCSTFSIAREEIGKHARVCTVTLTPPNNVTANSSKAASLGLAKRDAVVYKKRSHHLCQIQNFFDNPADWQALLQNLSSKGYLCDHQIKMQQADGTPLWSAVSLQQLNLNDEAAILGIFHNITSYKQESEGCFNLTGYQPADLIENQKVSFYDITYSDDRERVQQEVQAALRENRPYQLEYRITTATGEHKWVWEQGRGVFSAAGTQLALEGFITDITERKRAEEEIHLLQTMTQAIGEAPDFPSALHVALSKVCEVTGWNFGEAWVKNSDGTHLECSTTWYSNTEAGEQGSRGELLKSSLLNSKLKTQNSKLKTLPPLPTPLSEFQRQSKAFTFAPGTGLPGQVWASRQPVWVPDVSIEPETFFARADLAKGCGLRAGFGVPILANDDVLAVLTFFMFESRQEDRRLVELISAVAAQLGAVIQRKQTEAALRESQRRLASLMDSLPGIVFSCASDPEWSMTYLSEGCLALTGYTSEELIGNRSLSFDAITHQNDLPKVLAALETGVAQKQAYVVEYRIRTKSGQEKWLWEKGHGVFDSTGKILGVEGFITDITERKRSEDALG